MGHEMFSYDEEMGDLVFDYCRKRLSFDPVTLDFAGEKGPLDAALAGLMRPEGNDPATVLEIFTDHLAPAVISVDSPRFLAFIPAAPTRASMLFDMIVSCSSLQGSTWLEAAGVVVAENQALRVIADLAGLPPAAGGVFVSGGSAGNLSALAVARDTARKRLGGERRHLRVAVSDQTHSSVRNALRLLDMDALLVPTIDHRLTGSSLRQALDHDPGSDDVAAVVATAGTTNAGIVEDLAGIGQVAAERQLWFHVDGAYGGGALFAPSARDLFAGIERADSFVVDPHKWLFAPFDCAALLYRDPALAAAVHTQQASYLDVFHQDSDWNPSDYAYHLTRRARRHGPVVLPGRPRDRRLPDRRRRRPGPGQAHGAPYRGGRARGAGPGTGIVHRPVPPPRLATGGLPTLVEATPRRPGGLRHAHGVGRRDDGTLRFPQPRHHHRDGRRDPGHHDVELPHWPSRPAAGLTASGPCVRFTNLTYRTRTSQESDRKGSSPVSAAPPCPCGASGASID